MKRRLKITTVTVLILLVISLGLNIVFAVNQGAEPGSDQDPIVSKSYVDAAVAQLMEKIQSLEKQNDELKKTVSTLKEELKTVKSGTAAGTGSSPTGSAGNTGNSGDAGNSATKPPASLGKAAVNTAVLNLRSQPNTTSPIAGKLLMNETVTLVSKSGDWYKVTTSKGKTGFVMGKFVTIKK